MHTFTYWYTCLFTLLRDMKMNRSLIVFAILMYQFVVIIGKHVYSNRITGKYIINYFNF